MCTELRVQSAQRSPRRLRVIVLHKSDADAVRRVVGDKADKRGEEALKALFAIEDEIGVGAYYWYEIINWIGDIADYAERAGNRIRLLIAS